MREVTTKSLSRAPSPTAPVSALSATPIHGSSAGREFHLVHCLGRGGFGEVYRARIRSSGGLEFDAALKILHGPVDESGQSVERLRDEGRLLARLDHPVILRAHDLVVLEGRVGLITEYVDGQDLADCLLGDGKLPRRALLQVLAGVCEALDVAWSTLTDEGRPLQLVHRDIKPSNIRITRHGAVKLLDFGIARSDEMTREARTESSMLVGSLPYMAPERFQEASIEPASDVFALGCVLYEGLTGERFLAKVTAMMMMAFSSFEERWEPYLAGRLAQLDRTVPRALADVQRTMLQWDPAKRPTAAQLASLFEQLADELPGEGLKEWARHRTWPTVKALDAPWTGRKFYESSASIQVSERLAVTPAVANGSAWDRLPATHTAPTEPAPRRRSPLLVALGGVSLVAVVVLAVGFGVAAGGAAVGFGAGWFGGTEQPEVVAAQTAAGPTTPTDVGSPLSETPPTATVATPVSQEPEAVPAQSTEPPSRRSAKRPSAPASSTSTIPEAEVAPVVVETAPEPPKPGRVAVLGQASVELRQGDRRVSPGEVAPGAYEVWADFGQGPKHVRDIDVVAGGTLTLTCKKLVQNCEVSP